MNKFEKLIELIVNEDESQAKKLFHEIVVEQSRTIYESMIEEDDHDDDEDMEEMEEEVEGDEVAEGLESIISVEEAKQLLDHIDGTLNESDAGDLLARVAEHFEVDVAELTPVLESHGDELLEMAYGEAEDDDMEAGEEEMDAAIDDFNDDGVIDDHEADHAFHGEEQEDIEDRVVDLEDAIDELKAEFDALIGDDEMGMDDMGDDDMEMDDVEDMAMDVSSDEEMEEAMVREYVEKKTAPTTGDNEEGDTNTHSVVAGKNDMGGTTANILGDQSEEKGMTAEKPGDLDHAGNFQNDPKAKAGKTSFKKKETGKMGPKDSEKSVLDGPKG